MFELTFELTGVASARSASPIRSLPRAVTATWALAVAATLAALARPGSALAQEGQRPPERPIEEKVQRSFHGPDGAKKDGPMAKVGPKLIELYHRYRQHRAKKEARPFEPAQPRMPVTDGRVLEKAGAGEAYVTVDAVASGDPSALRDSLEALGLRQSAQAGRVVSGLLPIGALRQAAGLSLMNSAAPSIISSGPSPRQIEGEGIKTFQDAGTGGNGPEAKRVGATTTQGDVALRADRARERFRADGSGTKVCAVSTSYDNSEEASTTATEDIQSGDLPGSGNPNGFTQPVDVVEESPEPTNDEGRAMLQIIHDIAPGARLGFLSPFGEAGFVQGISQLATSGCDIIADDLTFYSQPMFQDGLISQEVDQVARDQGVAYFNAAGNEGIDSYARSFSGSGQPASSVGIDDEGELHDFDPESDVDVRQQIVVPAGGRLLMGLQWDDPFFRVSGEPGADTDLDLYLLDGENVVASSRRDNVGEDPWEFLAYQNDENQARSLDLAVVLVDGPEPDRLKYVIEQGGEIIEYATDSPTVFAHNDAAGTISVGASAWFNTPRVPEGSPADPSDPPVLNGFSSKGGTPLLFDEDGNRLPGPLRRDKPDITATDGGNTTFFGSDVSDQIDTDNFPNFFGTSAASPHAAAVAALMLGVRSGLSPDQIERRLEESTADIQDRFVGEVTPIQDGEGYDRFSGTGLVRADRAVRSVLPVQVAGLEASAEAPGEEPAAPVSLRWQTVFERDSEAFVVERRPGPLTPEARRSDEGWTQVEIVPSSAPDGASSDTLQYEFSGQVPTPGRYAFRLRHRTEGGPETGRPIGAATEAEVPIRGGFSVGGPQPNPSRGTPQVEVVVEEGQRVRAMLYDALGRRVRTLLDERLRGETPRLIRPEGRELASGTYFLRVRGKDFTETRKLVVVR